MAIKVFLSRSHGLLNRGPGGPPPLGHVPQSSIFSPTGLISNCTIGAWGPALLDAGFLNRILSPTPLIINWLNFLCTELYNSSMSTFFLWASQIALIRPVHGQGYILIFLDRMHLLFTQMHFLFWQPGRVGGQYTYIHIYIHTYIYIYMEGKYIMCNVICNPIVNMHMWFC